MSRERFRSEIFLNYFSELFFLPCLVCFSIVDNKFSCWFSLCLCINFYFGIRILHNSCNQIDKQFCTFFSFIFMSNKGEFTVEKNQLIHFMRNGIMAQALQHIVRKSAIINSSVYCMPYINYSIRTGEKKHRNCD